MDDAAPTDTHAGDAPGAAPGNWPGHWHDHSPGGRPGGRPAGTLTPRWQIALAVGWVGVIAGLVFVAVASDGVGLSVWWRGPDTARTNGLVMMVPFAGPALATAAAARNTRWSPFVGIAAAFATGLVALGDIDRVPGLAAVEALIAVGGLLVSVGSISGMYRRSAAPN